MKLSLKAVNYILFGIIALVLIAAVVSVYKTFFQFKNSDVKRFIKEEASKYSDPAGAGALIHEGVMHILNDRHLSRQVIREAEMSKTPKEQVLVASGLIQCKLLGYLQ